MQRTIPLCLLLCFLVGISFSTKAQKLQATPTHGLVQFEVLDNRLTPYQAEVHFLGKTTNKEFVATSKKTEAGEILLPINETYLIFTTNSTDRYEIPLSNRANQFYKLPLQFDNSRADQLLPNPHEGLVIFNIVNHKKEGQQVTISVRGKSTDFHITGKTNEEGKYRELLPKGQDYVVDVGNTENYSEISIPSEYFYQVQKLIQFEGAEIGELQPSKTHALFNLVYVDTKDKPVKNEVFTVVSTTTGEKYTTNASNAEGLAQVQVPIGDTYQINAKHFAEVAVREVPSTPDLYFIGVRFKYVSSEVIENRAKQQLKLIAIRDSAYAANRKAWLKEKRIADSLEIIAFNQLKRKQDSLQQVQNMLDSVQLLEQLKLQHYIDSVEKVQKVYDDFMDSVKVAGWSTSDIALFKEKERIKQEVIKESGWYEPALKKDPNFFESNGYEVSAVLFRIKNKWKNKTIVTDLTCSMYPYGKQLMLWLALQSNATSDKHFYFFNDGNGKPDYAKLIGKTGGIHQISSSNLDSVILLMAKTMNTGCSGDAAENDLEALIMAQKNLSESHSLILVADNYSPVRDFELLNQIQRPVHIVLCGVNDQNPINDEYLTLAFVTGGSVHTIDKDIENIQDQLKGATLQVDGYDYELLYNRFFRVFK